MNGYKLKLIGSWIIVVVAMIVCTGCKKDSDADSGSTDDSVLGSYTYKTSGTLDLYISGVKSTTLPMISNGSFTIIPANDPDSVLIVGALPGGYDSIHAAVHGNQIELAQSSYYFENSFVTLKATLSNVKAPMENKAIIWETDVMGLGTFSTSAITADGHMRMDAKKK